MLFNERKLIKKNNIKIQEGQLAGYQMTNDYKGKDFTASVTTVNNDIVQNSGLFLNFSKDLR